MDTPTTAAKDKRVEIAIHHWAPRFVSSGVPLTQTAGWMAERLGLPKRQWRADW